MSMDKSEIIKMVLELYSARKEVEKPRDFDPFGHAGFAHLWLQYD